MAGLVGEPKGAQASAVEQNRVATALRQDQAIDLDQEPPGGAADPMLKQPIGNVEINAGEGFTGERPSSLTLGPPVVGP